PLPVFLFIRHHAATRLKLLLASFTIFLWSPVGFNLHYHSRSISGNHRRSSAARQFFAPRRQTIRASDGWSFASSPARGQHNARGCAIVPDATFKRCSPIRNGQDEAITTWGWSPCRQ